ncbi:hypothetical protein MG295_00069 [Bacillus phage vB_BcgM]|nr:hypothetical protein MG295_00069 [Bacillus phage vB_BcgM]
MEKEAKEVKKTKVEPLMPYVHIDTFLETAKYMFELSDTQLAGFKASMNGQHYQRDELIFLDNLKKHFNLK